MFDSQQTRRQGPANIEEGELGKDNCRSLNLRYCLGDV